MKRHQKEFEQYLEDWKRHDKPWELWEVRWIGCLWISMCWDHITYFGREDVEFRRKPDTIKIGDYTLAKPLTEEPKSSTDVFAFTPESNIGYLEITYTRTIEHHQSLLKHGCLFKEEEHALEWVKWWRETVINQLNK